MYYYELLLWTSFSNNIIFVLFCFSLLEPLLWERDWFSTQYFLVWIIVVDPFFFVLSFCLLFFSFGASFVPKKLVSNSLCISMNYCCRPLSPTMSFLFCFVLFFSFGATFVRKRLVFNSISISMDYCCGSISPTILLIVGFICCTLIFSRPYISIPYLWPLLVVLLFVCSPTYLYFNIADHHTC